MCRPQIPPLWFTTSAHAESPSYVGRNCWGSWLTSERISPIVTEPVVMPVSLLPFAAFGWVGWHVPPPGCDTTPLCGFDGCVPGLEPGDGFCPPGDEELLGFEGLTPGELPPLGPAGAELEFTGAGAEEEVVEPGMATEVPWFPEALATRAPIPPNAMKI